MYKLALILHTKSFASFRPIHHLFTTFGNTVNNSYLNFLYRPAGLIPNRILAPIIAR